MILDRIVEAFWGYWNDDPLFIDLGDDMAPEQIPEAADGDHRCPTCGKFRAIDDRWVVKTGQWWGKMCSVCARTRGIDVVDGL